MNTAIAIGSIALALAGAIATGQAFGQERAQPVTKETAQEKPDQRESAAPRAL